MAFLSTTQSTPYRGRLAPSPTGLLHVGHACTFWTAYQRSRQHGGTLVFRNEDLDPRRSKPEFARAMIDDLQWLGIRWQEGPDMGGPFAPYEQSRRRDLYLTTWRKLREGGFIYPCTCSRKDLANSSAAPNEGDDEPLYPGRCRDRMGEAGRYESPAGVNWRFRVPDGEAIGFDDRRQGPQRFVAGQRLRRLRGMAARRRARVSACSGGRRRYHADHRSGARRRSAEVHRAAIAADSRAWPARSPPTTIAIWCATKPAYAWPSATMR